MVVCTNAIEPKEWLELNAKLQKKKNAVRKVLKEKGILQKGGKNSFDKYTYFSEAQYKQLFTELFSEHGLELKFNEVAYDTFSGTEKQSNGRMPKLEFELMDIDTGFGETTCITGEGIDKGDKAGYKAYTGALKYYLANTFMVATGDDPEKESPAEKMNDKNTLMKATDKQIAYLKEHITNEEDLQNFLKKNKLKSLEDMTMKMANDLIDRIMGGQKDGKQNGFGLSEV